MTGTINNIINQQIVYIWYWLVILDGSCRLQFRTLHINTVFVHVLAYGLSEITCLQLPSEITSQYHIIMYSASSVI